MSKEGQEGQEVQHDTGRKAVDKHSGHGFDFSETMEVSKGCSMSTRSLCSLVFSERTAD
jgi:hypothetical protein